MSATQKTSTYEIRLHRLIKGRMGRFLHVTIRADSFLDALERAALMVSAASAVAPSDTFRIASICDTGLHGVPAVHGWLTEVEYEEQRLAEADRAAPAKRA